MVASAWVEDDDTSAAKLLNAVSQSFSEMKQLVEMTPRESRL